MLITSLGRAGEQQQLLLLLDAQLDRDQMLVPGGPEPVPAQAGEGKHQQAARLQGLHAAAGRLAAELMVKVEKLVPLPVELLDVFAAILEDDPGPQQTLLDPDQQIRTIARPPQ